MAVLQCCNARGRRVWMDALPAQSGLLGLCIAFATGRLRLRRCQYDDGGGGWSSLRWWGPAYAQPPPSAQPLATGWSWQLLSCPVLSCPAPATPSPPRLALASRPPALPHSTPAGRPSCVPRAMGGPRRAVVRRRFLRRCCPAAGLPAWAARARSSCVISPVLSDQTSAGAPHRVHSQGACSTGRAMLMWEGRQRVGGARKPRVGMAIVILPPPRGERTSSAAGTNPSTSS
jgi:hypothetical protein